MSKLKINKAFKYMTLMFLTLVAYYILFGIGATVGRYQLDRERSENILKIAEALNDYIQESDIATITEDGEICLKLLPQNPASTVEKELSLINPARKLFEPDFFSYPGLFVPKIIFNEDYFVKQSGNTIVIYENTYKTLDRQYTVKVDINNDNAPVLEVNTDSDILNY